MNIKLLIVLLVLISCGPAAKLRRAERLIAKAELQGAHWGSDTVWKSTDVFIPVIHTDTVVLNTPGDTITITRDRLQVKLKIRRDSIYVDGKCLPDTIRIKVPVTVTKTIEARAGMPWWAWVLIAIGFIVGLWMGAKLFRK